MDRNLADWPGDRVPRSGGGPAEGVSGLRIPCTRASNQRARHAAYLRRVRIWQTATAWPKVCLRSSVSAAKSGGATGRASAIAPSEFGGKRKYLSSRRNGTATLGAATTARINFGTVGSVDLNGRQAATLRSALTGLYQARSILYRRTGSEAPSISATVWTSFPALPFAIRLQPDLSMARKAWHRHANGENCFVMSAARTTHRTRGRTMWLS